MSEGRSKPKPSADLPAGYERRHNFELRERLDEIVRLARRLSREAREMSREELDEVRERIEWVAEEVWESAAFGPLEDRAKKQ